MVQGAESERGRSLEKIIDDLAELAKKGVVLNASLVVRTPDLKVIKQEFDAPGAGLSPAC